MKIINLCNIMVKLNIINYCMQRLIENEDNSYDCNESFLVNDCLVYKGKFIIKFNKINGFFYCCENNLISLEGSPEIIKGDFYCHNNKLTNLKYCPKKIGGCVDCSHNQLISLKFCPKKINGSFMCFGNSKKITKKEVRKVCNVLGEIRN
jgi:hypothetical protein